MNEYLADQTQTTSKRTLLPITGHVLQRQCACGQHTSAGGECEECKQKRAAASLADAQLQRAAIQPSALSPQPSEIPPMVDEVLRSPGQPLDSRTRTFMESSFGNDFSRVPIHTAMSSAADPTRYAVSRSGDQSEQEADRMADEVIRVSESGASRRFEHRTGYDFSRVRVHTDAQADLSAQALGATAYTVGQHVVFAAGQYAPYSSHGRHLLAHELAHVVQQSGLNLHRLSMRRDRKPKSASKPAKFYQQVIDAYEAQKAAMAEQARRSPLLVREQLNFQGLKALIPLCEAVEQERTADIPRLLDAFIKADIGFHLGTISEQVMVELAARMHKLGLVAESSKLRAHYSENEKALSFLGYDQGSDRRNVMFYTRLVELAVSSADPSTPEKIETSLDVMIRAFVPLRDSLAAIDLDALNWERQTGSDRFTFRPEMSRKEYFDALKKLVEQLFSGIESMLQALIDSATVELEGSAGTKTLVLAREVIETRLRPAVFPADATKSIAGLKLEITRTTLKKGRGMIADAFLRGKAAKRRSVAVTAYDPEQELAPELQMSLERLYEVRQEQILALARIYGAVDLLPREKPGLTDDAARNAEAIKKTAGGRLRLHSNDDWRVFLLQKYRDLVQPTGQQPKRSPAEALSAIIDLLFAYLHAFTVHARYTNIYDIGDSYLNKDFPRALSGQLVHDCGVYALRVAYILSLVRNELKLRFRFVVLPVHVALVIDGDNLPTFIVHNDHFEEISAEEWARLRKAWQAYAETKQVTDESGMVTIEMQQQPPGPKTETQFIGELAGATFISGPIDMPFKVVDVPTVGNDAKAAQRKLWNFYQRTATAELFGPASKKKGDPAYLFHSRYLALTEQMREVHNDVILKFWNQDAPAAWVTLDQQLGRDGQRTSIPSVDLLGLLKDHRLAYNKALAPVDARLQSLQAQERTISAELRGNPKLRHKGVQLSYGPRAATLWTYFFISYRDRLNVFIEDLTRQPARDVTLKGVRDRLAPPFVPAEEKRLSPLD